MDVTLENNSRVRSDERFGEVTESCQTLLFILQILHLYIYSLDRTILRINHKSYYGGVLTRENNAWISTLTA